MHFIVEDLDECTLFVETSLVEQIETQVREILSQNIFRNPADVGDKSANTADAKGSSTGRRSAAKKNADGDYYYSSDDDQVDVGNDNLDVDEFDEDEKDYIDGSDND